MHEKRRLSDRKSEMFTMNQQFNGTTSYEEIFLLLIVKPEDTCDVAIDGCIVVQCTNLAKLKLIISEIGKGKKRLSLILIVEVSLLTFRRNDSQTNDLVWMVFPIQPIKLKCKLKCQRLPSSLN